MRCAKGAISEDEFKQLVENHVSHSKVKASLQRHAEAKGVGKGMGRQTQEIKVVLNASVFLDSRCSLDEPKEVAEGAMANRLLEDVISGKVLAAFVPDRFEDEVLGGLVEASDARDALILGNSRRHFLRYLSALHGKSFA